MRSGHPARSTLRDGLIRKVRDAWLIRRGPARAAVLWSVLVFAGMLIIGPWWLGHGDGAVKGDGGVKGELVKNFHVLLLASTGAIGTLVFKAAQDRAESEKIQREEQKAASDGLIVWLEKLKDPTTARAAWRAIADNTLREPWLESQTIALSQDALQLWLDSTVSITQGPEPSARNRPAPSTADAEDRA